MKIDVKVSEMLDGQFMEKCFACGEKVLIAPHVLLRKISRDLGLDMNCVERAVFLRELFRSDTLATS